MAAQTINQQLFLHLSGIWGPGQTTAPSFGETDEYRGSQFTRAGTLEQKPVNHARAAKPHWAVTHWQKLCVAELESHRHPGGLVLGQLPCCCVLPPGALPGFPTGSSTWWEKSPWASSMGERTSNHWNFARALCASSQGLPSRKLFHQRLAERCFPKAYPAWRKGSSFLPSSLTKRSEVGMEKHV